MLKKLTWKDGAVFSLKLNDDLYSLCQMRNGSVMEFFARCAADDAWSNVDLNRERVLCQYFVAENRLKPLFAREIEASELAPNRRPANRLMLSPIIEANDRYGANLVRLNDTFDILAKELVKGDLDKTSDWETICAHDLTGMQGSPDKLKARLTRYFETGIWWDEQKSFLFRGIRIPGREDGFVPRTAAKP
jgi:hypothetical protein